MSLTKSQGRPATVCGDLTMLQLWCILNWPRAYFGDKERGQKHTKQTINYYSIIGQGFNEAGGCSLVHLCQPESLTWVAQSKHVLISISPCATLALRVSSIRVFFPSSEDQTLFTSAHILFVKSINQSKLVITEETTQKNTNINKSLLNRKI